MEDAISSTSVSKDVVGAAAFTVLEDEIISRSVFKDVVAFVEGVLKDISFTIIVAISYCVSSERCKELAKLVSVCSCYFYYQD